MGFLLIQNLDHPNSDEAITIQNSNRLKPSQTTNHQYPAVKILKTVIMKEKEIKDASHSQNLRHQSKLPVTNR
ncbi:hypothetical protein C1H46_027951 [Malus baccata]|uniref:Uncharacterized protein n=1 Tax=Malus baccata TaxID=106549 RepID=A0A540LJJ4_MALBA|nr:hypothetical protein C1H46_027951 [Malus baccata]